MYCTLPVRSVPLIVDVKPNSTNGRNLFRSTAVSFRYFRHLIAVECLLCPPPNKHGRISDRITTPVRPGFIIIFILHPEYLKPQTQTLSGFLNIIIIIPILYGRPLRSWAKRYDVKCYAAHRDRTSFAQYARYTFCSCSSEPIHCRYKNYLYCSDNRWIAQTTRKY